MEKVNRRAVAEKDTAIKRAIGTFIESRQKVKELLDLPNNQQWEDRFHRIVTQTSPERVTKEDYKFASQFCMLKVLFSQLYAISSNLLILSYCVF